MSFNHLKFQIQQCRMFVCIYDNPRCVWVRFPKTGSTSVKHGFFSGRPPDKRLDHIPDGYGNYRTFTVVRNPYSRMASILSMFRNHKSAKTPEEIALREALTVEQIISILKNPDIDPKRVKQSNYFERLKLHALPMTAVPEVLGVNRVFRFETFPEMWKGLAAYLGVSEPNLLHLKNKYPKIDLTVADRNAVADYYREDFEAFGYDI